MRTADLKKASHSEH